MATTSIANPLYDTVFKFLMEDQRVAQILISALIKKKVRSLVQTANETVSLTNDGFKLLRIDFAAEVEVAEGKYEVTTIEVQKAFLDSEIVRFRKYLAEQYAGKANKVSTKTIRNDNGDEVPVITETPLPITAIYILGHSTVDKTHPIIYGNTKYSDGDDAPNDGVEESDFLVGLTHRIIVVQVPSLDQKPKTHVEKFLSIFNQSYKSDSTNQILNIEPMEDAPEGYDIVVNRLVHAAADEKLRQAMRNEEDAILEFGNYWMNMHLLEEKVAKQEAQLSQQEAQLSQQEATIISSIKMLASCGVSAQQIAKQLNLSEVYVEKVTSEL